MRLNRNVTKTLRHKWLKKSNLLLSLHEIKTTRIGASISDTRILETTSLFLLKNTTLRLSRSFQSAFELLVLSTLSSIDNRLKFSEEFEYEFSINNTTPARFNTCKLMTPQFYIILSYLIYVSSNPRL